MVYKSEPITESSKSHHEDFTGSCNDDAGNARIEKTNLNQLPSGTIDPDTSPRQEHSRVEGESIKSSPQPPRKGADKQKKRLFGIAQDKYLKDNILQVDYEARYPPDQIGHEMGPNARVWRVYLDEAEPNDRDMVEGWKDGIDVLLVFAGLFSAVVTTFVTQTSQKLDQDYGSITVSLLAEAIAIQRTVAVGGLVADVPAAVPGPGSSPRYTNGDVWVNALWFTSLILSLITALSAVLIKQWIQHYVSFVSGTAQERARIHQFRYAGLEKWGVRGIMSALPVLLYAALFLFIFGLVVFLQALKGEIAIVVGVIGGIAFVLYVVTNGLPLFYPQCPYYTPLIELIHTAKNFTAFTYRQLSFYIICRAIPKFLSHPAVAYLHKRYEKQTQPKNSDRVIKANPPKYEPAGHKLAESQAAILDQDKIIVDIITWLLRMSSNPSVKPIALQSISGLYIGFSRISELLGQDSLVRGELWDEAWKQYFQSELSEDDFDALIDSPSFYKLERFVRACFFVPNGPVWAWEPRNWNKFDEALTNLGDDVPLPFKQALATYRVGSMSQSHESPTLAEISSLSASFVTAAIDSPALCNAWSHIFHKCSWAPCSTLEAYSHFGELFRASSLGSDLMKSDGFHIILPFLCQVLPQIHVKEYLGYSPKQRFLTMEVIETTKVKFYAMALQGVVDEWNENRLLEQNRMTEIEALISDIASQVPQAVLLSMCDASLAEQAIKKLLQVLDRLTFHPNFIQSHMKKSTYVGIFIIYDLAHSKSADLNDASHKTGLFSSLERIRAILSTPDCVYGLSDALFSLPTPYEHCRDIPLQVIAALEGQEVDDQMVQNAFDAFSGFHYWTKIYSEEETFTITSPSYWAPTTQPLVRWTLDYVMAHSGTENSRASVDAMATNLIGRPGFLTFTCSSLLFDGLGAITVSKESDVLLRLAAYHKDKPGAVDAWHHFFSHIQNKADEMYEGECQQKDWTREEHEKYGHVADLVDQLASCFRFDDPVFKIRRFEDSCITENQKRTQDTPKAITSPSTNNSWPSLFRKLLPGGLPSDGNVAGNVDLESNQKNRDSWPISQ